MNGLDQAGQAPADDPRATSRLKPSLRVLRRSVLDDGIEDLWSIGSGARGEGGGLSAESQRGGVIVFTAFHDDQVPRDQ